MLDGTVRRKTDVRRHIGFILRTGHLGRPFQLDGLSIRNVGNAVPVGVRKEIPARKIRGRIDPVVLSGDRRHHNRMARGRRGQGLDDLSIAARA